MTMPREGLFGELFGDGEMAHELGDASLLMGMLAFESNLARALEITGMAPAGTARTITEQCDFKLYDAAALGKAATLAGNPAIPLVKALTERVSKIDPAAARWVHYGATSQDVIDSGREYQFERGIETLLGRLNRIIPALAELARTHRRTPMIGRTFLQHAVPISFGVKAALWLDPLLESRARLGEVRPIQQFAGAAGTLASLGDVAVRAQEAFRDLTQADAAMLTPWHAQRHRLVRLAAELGILTGSLGKIAQDIALMAQTEIGELAEPEAPGKGGSSAMPHKRNPVLCTLILAAARRAPGLVSTMLAAMPQEHERAMGGWHAEWPTMAELFMVAGSALNQAVTLILGLQVFPDRMRQNLDLTNGLVMAERVSLALASTIGRGEAHHVLEEASRTCVASGRHLKDVLAGNEALAGKLSPAQLDALFEPTTYRGASDAIIDRVLARSEQEAPAGPPSPTREYGTTDA
ncbi:3-carboxy-cis,cis-muconate cycloisomerase [Bosea sp. BK604]|uniref:3-carboxy-cis,cis-muconate cycloisomerase n=1 Tax=Bosea sp. BK604 TaxID=2512180 RepID=UPI0010DC429E|nr:3-carboxy-cis,cis-muconate cycloisomerase [Bosea sp. BK604]TCR63572.1 3-carboxy-cis,cis-muconate cycloisomerase [Bosea sp. BK604]